MLSIGRSTARRCLIGTDLFFTSPRKYLGVIDVEFLLDNLLGETNKINLMLVPCSNPPSLIPLHLRYIYLLTILQLLINLLHPLINRIKPGVLLNLLPPIEHIAVLLKRILKIALL